MEAGKEDLDSEHRDLESQVVQRSQWQAVFFEASGLSAALSEESMRGLKYCLHWLQVRLFLPLLPANIPVSIVPHSPHRPNPPRLHRKPTNLPLLRCVHPVVHPSRKQTSGNPQMRGGILCIRSAKSWVWCPSMLVGRCRSQRGGLF